MRNRRLFTIFIIIGVLTLIVVLSSVVFSVQHVYEDCINADSSVIMTDNKTLGEAVLDSHGIKKGESIFLADKEAAEARIEARIPSVNVLFIEKRFPNRIYITYEVLFDYFELQSGGNYYTLSDNSKITSVSKTAKDADKIVRVYVGGDVLTQKAGDFLKTSKSGEAELLAEILSSLKSLGQEYYEITQLFEFIDIRSDYEYIYIKTSTGVYLRLIGWDTIPLKLQSALSLYGHEMKYRLEGTITVSDSLLPTYSTEVLYSPYLN